MIGAAAHRSLVTLVAILAFTALKMAGASAIELSPSEKDWIANHPVLRVANEMDWPPFDFAEHGEPKGYSVDLTALIAQKLGLRIEFVTGMTWAELMERFKAGEIDVMPAIYASEERRMFARFSTSYFSQPSVMAVGTDDDSIHALADLNGRRVAAIRGFMISDTLRDQFPNIEHIPVGNVIEGMKAVSTGDADACIDSIGVMSYVAREHYIPNIKILTHVPLKELANPDLHMAVGKDQPVLQGLLDKGIDSLTIEELETLRQAWLHVPGDNGGALPEAPTSSASKGPFSWWLLSIVVVVLIGLRLLSRVIDRPVSESEMARMSGARRFWLAVTFANLKISAKILIILVFVSATSVGMFGYMDYQEARQALRTESFNKLTAVREMKAQQIEDYFDTIEGQVVTFSESRTVIEAMSRFRTAFAALDGAATADHAAAAPADPELIAYYEDEFFPRLSKNATDDAPPMAALDFTPIDPRARHLQEEYIAENPHPTGEKALLDDADDGSDYSAVHRSYHPIIRSFLKRFGYYDIFLIDHETGRIIYSVFKEVDYATSLLTGPYRDTNLAAAFRQARGAARGSFVHLEDFAPYQPSYNAPGSFIASPIFDGDEKVGVLVFQMPIDRINGIMTSHQAWTDVGLGKSGETYLVGKDYKMRNQSRFLIEDRDNYLKMIREIGLASDTIQQIEKLNTSIGLQRVETRGTQAALAGRTNTEVFPDYRGIPVLSSYRILNLPGVRWAIMSEIDVAEAMAPAERLKRRTMVLMLLFMGVILAISFAFAKTMTRPIKVLTAKANALAEGDLGVSIQIGGGDEIAQLGRSFDTMRKALADLIGGLEQKVAERTSELAHKSKLLQEQGKLLEQANERMSGELNVGREIQMSMVPLTFPAFPERNEFDIFATLQPAREVGGDFYDFFFVDDDWFFFCVGDVSDKGVPAALFMAVTKTLIKSRATDDFSPSSILTRVNDELSEDNPACMFVTVLVAALNMRTGELRYSNAGHNPPYIKRCDGKLDLLDARHGPVIGAVGGIAYKEGQTRIERGDMVFLYTDGVTEAQSPGRELYSEDRLTALIDAHACESPRQLVTDCVAAVDAFQGKDHQADDITVLALQYLGVPINLSEQKFEVTIKSQLDNIAQVDDQFAAFADEAGVPKPVARKVRLACDELLNNIISYAYTDGVEHEIQVEMQLLSDRLTISISDDGAPFNPFQREPPDTTGSLSEREVGGLGIHLVRTVMNKTAYSRHSGRNVVTLVKHLEAAADNRELSKGDEDHGNDYA